MFINKYNTRSIICSIAVFFHSISILGMDDTAITLGRITHKQEADIAYANRSFLDGLSEYRRGNIDLAKIILDASHTYTKEHNLLEHINPLQLENACSILCKIHHDQGNFAKALEFATNSTEKGIIYRHMAQKAHDEGKLDLEKECYAHAFNLFKDAYRYDPKAKKHYENALWCGLGYEHDHPSMIREYLFNKLHSSHILLTDEYLLSINKELHGITKKEHRKAVQELQRLAQDDAATQALFADLYLNGSIFSHSYDKSLEFCQKAISSFATILPQKNIYLPSEYSQLTHIIFQLRTSNTDIIRKKAIILGHYFEILSAIKTMHQPKIKRLGSEYAKKTDLQSALFQLLCSNVPETTIQLINNITFDDPAFTQLVNDDEIAPDILRWNMLDASLEPHIKDLFHIIIGGYEYHNKNFDAALAEFKQCSDFKENFYLQALALQMDTDETSRKKKLVSIVPLLHNSLDSSSKNKQVIAAKEIVAEICGYNDSNPAENIISMCQHWVPQLAVVNRCDYPLEYVQVLLGLNDLRKKTKLSIEQQQEIIKLGTYFDFFSLLQANDQKGLDAFFSKKNTNVKGIRRIILQAIRGNKKNGIQKIDLKSDVFNKFCDSDLFLLKIIEHIAQHPQERFKIKPAQCDYLLDGFAAQQKEDYLAQALLSQVNILEATRAQDILAVLEPCIVLLDQVKENDNRSTAEIIITNKIITSYKEYVDIILKNKDYKQAYKFVLYLAQLDQLVPSQIICNIFTAIEKSMLQETHHAYHILLEIPDRISTYNIIKALADQKKPDCCDCIAFILYEHSMCPHLEASDTTALEKECFNYLSYSLKDDNRTNNEDKRIKRSLYNQLACYFGILERSTSFLDEAINYGSTRALYEKATLLSQKKPISPEDLATTINLLERHIVSDDDNTRRGKSYKTLGKYYFSIKELESQKKAFEYLKAASDLGNHDADYILGLFYIDGIEGYQIPDIEKGLICLQKAIDLEKSCANARYIQAYTCYEQNRYAQAQEGLVALFEYPKYSDSQKLFAYWLMGLTKLQLNENKDLSKDITSYFRTAYETALSHKSEDPNSPFIKQFILCNHENSVLTIQKNIDHIIENKKTDAASLDFCTVMGAVIFEQCAIKPIEDPLRQLAVKSLLYATQNGNNEAPFSLLCTAEEEVSMCDKIYYIEALRLSAPHLIEAINPLLAERYPTDVISQGRLLKNLVEKNNPPVLHSYTSQLYENKKPIITNPISYTVVSRETAEKIIAECSNLTPLIELADAFMKNPAKSTPKEHFMAMWRGSLLAYSLDEKLLCIGMNYLEKCREYFPTIQQEHIERNLGYIYYKLGWQQHKKNDLESAILLLKKGIFVGNKLCNDLFIKITQEQALLKTKIKKISSAIIQDVNAIYAICEKIIQSPHYINLVHQATDTLENQEEFHTNTMSVMNQKFTRKDYFKECDNPLICFNYLFDNYQETANNSNLQEALQKAIHLSTHNGMFCMKSTLERLCTFTKKIIEKNNKQQMELLFKVIKQELIKQKINIKAFEGLYKDIYKTNLAQNNIWKKIK